MSKIDLILKAIKAGVSASKIIAKYGKKAYNAAKEQLKQMDKVDKIQGNKPSTKFLLGAGTANIGAMAALDKYEKAKNKKNGGSVNSRTITKKYFKGGMV